ILVGLALAWLPPKRRSTAIALAFLLAPFVLAFSPVIQSGIRYLLPALPPAAILAAAGIDAAARKFSPYALRAAALASLISCLLIRPSFLHYSNFLFGGPRAALTAHRFVFGWWGEGIYPAVAWLNPHAPPGARVAYNLFPNHIVWLRDDVQVVRTAADADYFLLNHFQYEHPPAGFHEVFREDAAPGAPLSAVYVRNGTAAASASP